MNSCCCGIALPAWRRIPCYLDHARERLLGADGGFAWIGAWHYREIASIRWVGVRHEGGA